MDAHRANKRIIKLSTLQTVKRGNWKLRYSFTNMHTIMLIASSTLAPSNVFVKYSYAEEDASTSADFLVLNDFYNPYPENDS